MREHEVFPPPNPRLLTALDTADAIIYGMGSLYTSICPSLILKARSTPAHLDPFGLLKSGTHFSWRGLQTAL